VELELILQQVVAEVVLAMLVLELMPHQEMIILAVLVVMGW
jgi:hypothetical protein